jgi:hypothetical protein
MVEHQQGNISFVLFSYGKRMHPTLESMVRCTFPTVDPQLILPFSCYRIQILEGENCSHGSTWTCRCRRLTCWLSQGEITTMPVALATQSFCLYDIKTYSKRNVFTVKVSLQCVCSRCLSTPLSFRFEFYAGQNQLQLLCFALVVDVMAPYEQSSGS